MTFLPGMEAQVQMVRGGIGAAWGQQYSVYRVGPTTSNAVVSGTPVLTNYGVRWDTELSKRLIENVTFELQVYEGVCDASVLNFGDILVGTDGTDGAMYAYAQHRPTEPNVFVRVERNVNISRPATIDGAGSAGSQPDSGSVVASNYIGITQASEQYLTLTNGVYAFLTSGSMASVPFGLQPQNRPRGPHHPDFPSQVPEVQFVGYVPFMQGYENLGGVQIIENDIINSDNGDRYVVIQVFQSDDSGLAGWILLLKKISV